MIVKNNKDGCLGIPIVGGTLSVGLVPSYNEIDDITWASCRKNAVKLIEAGEITEEWAKVAPAEAKDTIKELVLDGDKDNKLIPAKLKDIDRKGNKVIKMVQETFHQPTLEKWYEEELRQDVRVELQKQLDGIEKGTIKG